MHGYLDSRVLQSDWYSERDHQGLLHALAEILPQGEPEGWRFIGGEAAKGHVTGPYKSILRGGPAGLIDNFQPYWRLSHSSGEWEIRETGAESRACRLADFAVGMPEYAPLMEGWFAQVLRFAGARDVEANCVDEDASGATWEVSWRGVEESPIVAGG